MNTRIGGLYRHKKSGHLYVVVTIAKLEKDLTPMVVYCRDNDTSSDDWIRPQSEFEDGRFEEI